MKQKKIRVGFDFDGVIAYNPLRIFRKPTKYLKSLVLGKKEIEFYYPKSKLEKKIWELIHETSFFPAPGVNELRNLLKKNQIEGYIITSRYSFLRPQLERWLQKHYLLDYFAGIYHNESDDQPHKFKEKMVKSLKLDYFLEDNLDIVEHLNKTTKTQIHWIYNILDHFIPYKNKHPHLRYFLKSLSRTIKWKNS